MGFKKRPNSKGLVLVVHSKETWADTIFQQLLEAGYDSRMYLQLDAAKPFMSKSGSKVDLILSDNSTWLHTQLKAGKKVLFLSLKKKKAKGLPTLDLECWDEREFIVLVHQILGIPFFPEQQFAAVLPKTPYVSTDQRWPTKFVVVRGDSGLVMYLGTNEHSLHSEVAWFHGVPYRRILGGAHIHSPWPELVMVTGDSHDYGGVPKFILEKFVANLLARLKKHDHRIGEVQVSVEPCGNEDDKFWDPYR